MAETSRVNSGNDKERDWMDLLIWLMTKSPELDDHQTHSTELA